MAVNEIYAPQIVSDVPIRNKSYWSITGYVDDATVAKVLKEAPGANLALFIIAIVLQCADATAFPHLEDEDENVLFSRVIGVTDACTVITKEFKRPIQLETNKALQLKAAAAGIVSYFIEGAIASASTEFYGS